MRVLNVNVMAACLGCLMSIGVQAKGVDPEAGSVTLSLNQEPPSLDTSLSEDTTSGLILRFTNEPLVRIDRRGNVLPGVAESWELEPRRATFTLRADAKWSDGKPVTAHDFVFAFRRLVDPKTAAAGSTFFAYVLENAEAIMDGHMPPSSLGVEALDDRTLRLHLSRPVPYLLDVMNGTAYMPLRQDFVEAQAGRHGADAANLLSNGPFKLDRWVHSASMALTRNPHYWNSEDVSLNQVDIGYITADTRSLLNLFKSGELAALRLDENILGDASEAGYRIKKERTNCVAWLLLNMRPDRPTANVKLRRAIRLAFDRDRYVNSIVGLPGVLKADSVFTNHIRGIKRSFPSEFPAPEIDYNVREAQRLLKEAKVELGVDRIPPVILLANETRQIDAEFVQSQLTSALDLEVRVDKQTFKQAIARMHAGEFDIARAAFCGGSLRDPVFFAGIFAEGGPFNNGAFNSPEYNQLLDLTHSSADQEARMKAFARMQDILFEDVPIIPTHVYSWIYLQDDRVDGFQRYPVVNFSRGYLDI